MEDGPKRLDRIPPALAELFEAAKPMIGPALEAFESKGAERADLGILVTDAPWVIARVARHAPAGARAVAITAPLSMLRALAAEYGADAPMNRPAPPGQLWCLIRREATCEVLVTTVATATLSPGGSA